VLFQEGHRYSAAAFWPSVIISKVVNQTTFLASPILRSARVNQGIGNSLCGHGQVRTFSSHKELAFALDRFGARFFGHGVSVVYYDRTGMTRHLALKTCIQMKIHISMKISTNLQIVVAIFINTKHDCHFLYVFVYGEQELADLP
jgi:hypothetical protein